MPFESRNAERPSIMSSTIRKPLCMTAVHTCTDVAPSVMNSAASRHVEMPPMPEIGTFTRGSCASCATMWSAIGFTAGPQ